MGLVRSRNFLEKQRLFHLTFEVMVTSLTSHAKGLGGTPYRNSSFWKNFFTHQFSIMGGEKWKWKIKKISTPKWFQTQTRFSKIIILWLTNLVTSLTSLPEDTYQVDFEISKKILHPPHVPYGGMFLEVKNPKNRTSKVVFHPNRIFKSHHFVVMFLTLKTADKEKCPDDPKQLRYY